MTGKIIVYTGPNQATVKTAQGEVSVRIAVNRPHPPIGGDIEFKESSVVKDQTSKLEDRKPAAPVPVTEQGKIHKK